jgi:hypothetical protein
VNIKLNAIQVASGLSKRKEGNEEKQKLKQKMLAQVCRIICI